MKKAERLRNGGVTVVHVTGLCRTWMVLYMDLSMAVWSVGSKASKYRAYGVIIARKESAIAKKPTGWRPLCKMTFLMTVTQYDYDSCATVIFWGQFWVSIVFPDNLVLSCNCDEWAGRMMSALIRWCIFSKCLLYFDVMFADSYNFHRTPTHIVNN